MSRTNLPFGSAHAQIPVTKHTHYLLLITCFLTRCDNGVSPVSQKLCYRIFLSISKIIQDNPMVSQLDNPNVNLIPKSSHTVKGLIHIFTTAHRNFFTDVMAQALRIAGQGTPVLVVQFLKGGIRQGHKNPTKLSQKLDWIRCDLPRCIDTPHLDDSETASLRDLWEYTQKVVAEDRYSLIVLDELSLAINFGLIPEMEVLEFLAKRPPHIDVIFTGSEIPKSILDMADQITEIRRSHTP